MLKYRDKNNPDNSTVHYFDQIVDNVTVQDFSSVACGLDSAIYCIKKQFPFITSLVVVFDNAVHFGCSWAWLQRYLNAGNDLLKPSQIVEGFRSYGGMPRSSSHLLKFNVQQSSTSPTGEFGNDASNEEDTFVRPSNPKGRPITPLGDF